MPHQCTNCGKTFADGSKEMLSGCPDCGGNKFQFRPKGATDIGGDDAASASTPSGVTPDSDSADGPPSDDDRNGVTGTAAKAGASVREWVGNRTSDADDADGAADASDASDAPDASQTDTGGRTAETSTESHSETSADSVSGSDDVTIEPADGSTADADVTDTEDRAQASARSDVVTPEELSAAENRPVEEQPADADGTVIEPESDDRPDLSDLREELNDQFESIKILSPGQYELNLMELYDREEYIISLREDGRYVIEVPDTWRGSESDG
jgi:hypothetical protein